MHSLFRTCSRLFCAIPLLACERAPVAPPLDSLNAAPAPALSTAEVPTAEELASMPAEFSRVPSIYNERTVVEFLPERGVYAQGLMNYYATDAQQLVTLTLRRDDRLVYTETSTGSREHLLPIWGGLITSASFSVSAECGNSADGSTRHRAFHKFLVGGWKFFSWGNEEATSGDDADQPTCPEPPPDPDGGGGGGDDPYDTGCQSCQQWFWYDYGRIVDEWWECEPVDAWRCGLES